MKKLNPYIKEIFLILLGALILCIPALHNGYPLMYSDTGTYIRSGFSGDIPPDRPIMYGLFIRHTTLAFSLWLTICVQSILLAACLYIFLKEILTVVQKFNFYYLLILGLLTAFTGVGWYASQIMPDIFTPIFILSFVSLLISKKLSIIKTVFLSVVFILSFSMHHSNLVIAIASSALLILFYLAARINKQTIFYTPKSLVSIISLSILSLFFLLIINYTHHGGFKVSKGSHAFLMAHFVETGTMQEYLKENCDKPNLEDCRICLYKDSLGNGSLDFLWNGKSSFYKMGGWAATEKEYDYVFKQMLSDPNYLIKNIFCSFRFGLSQLFLNNVGEGLCAYGVNSAPWNEVHNHFNWEENVYMQAKQQLGGIEIMPWVDKISDTHFWMLIFSIILISYYLFYATDKNNTLHHAGVLLVAFVIVNSFITAGLNVPYARLQNRVVWLIILYAIIIIINKKKEIICEIKKQIST